MTVIGDFQTCVLRLLDLMTGKEGISYVLVKETIGHTYFLYGLADPDLDWGKITAGEQRVVLCASRSELTALEEILEVRGTR